MTNTGRRNLVTRQSSPLVAAATLIALSLPAPAHELRVFGQYHLYLGMHDEPPVEDDLSGVEMFIYYDTNNDGICGSVKDCPVLDVDGKGDKVEELSPTQIMFLERDDFDAKVLASRTFPQFWAAPGKPDNGQLHHFFQGELHGEPFYYKYITPDVSGAYGFQIDILVKHHLDKGPGVHIHGIDGRFVCMRGTRDPGGTWPDGSHFDCVYPKPAPFPLPRRALYESNTTSDVQRFDGPPPVDEPATAAGGHINHNARMHRSMRRP